MNEFILSALTSVATCITTIFATVKAVKSGNELTAYRIAQLEERVNEHNNVTRRMYDVERRLDVDENRISVSEHRIKDLEGERAHEHGEH